MISQSEVAAVRSVFVEASSHGSEALHSLGLDARPARLGAQADGARDAHCEDASCDLW